MGLDSKLVSGHAVRPVTCTTMTGPAASRHIPQTTPNGSANLGVRPPPNPGPFSPNEPGVIFTANLKGVELANRACGSLEELAGAAEQGVGRVRGEPELLFSFLHQAGLSL
jgi:hypothetical protein